MENQQHINITSQNKLTMNNMTSIVPPEPQPNIKEEQGWMNNKMTVTSDMFNEPPFQHSLYEQQLSSFQLPANIEDQFNYNHHHRASLPLMHNNNLDLGNLPMLDGNAPVVTSPYNRRYTEGSIPSTALPVNNNNHSRGGRKQRMSSTSSKEENDMDEEDKRKHFLERNRQAALKCRQRKKQWLANLQHRVEYLSTDNEQLQNQATMLREEVLNLKTLLLAHRDCEVAQANGTTMNMIQSISSQQQPFVMTSPTRQEDLGLQFMNDQTAPHPQQ